MKTLFYTLANSIDLPNMNPSATDGQIQHILQIVFAIVGALAFLYMIIAGFRFITSSGNPESVAKAKNGILYAIIGLVVCLLAETIVTFVIGAL